MIRIQQNKLIPRWFRQSKPEDKQFEIIMTAVNKLVDFVAPTYGPAANKAIIKKAIYRMVVDDGVQIARDFELPDDAENAVIDVIKQAAIRTNDRAGDGTTGSLLMLRAIMKQIQKLSVRNGWKIEKELKQAVKEATDQIKAMARKIDNKQDLKRVAMIAYNNEPIAEMISDLLYQVGPEGKVSIEMSHALETTSHKTEGIGWKGGYLSPYMITDPQRNEAELLKCPILVTSYRLTNANDVLPIMNKLLEAGKRELLIVSDGVESDALATLIVNRVQGKFMAVAVSLPHVNKQEFLEDLCVLTGATLFGEDKGNRVDNAVVADLGSAARVVVNSDETLIAGAKGKENEIEDLKLKIRAALDENPRDNRREELESRLARVVNGVATIKVGAPTEAEQKALKYKIEDAIHATKAALKGGVIPGGGQALRNIVTSSELLNNAMKEPSKQLFDNVKMTPVRVYEGEAFNVVTEEKGDFMEVGVADPADVIIAGIESATSIASLLCTVFGSLVEETNNPQNN